MKSFTAHFPYVAHTSHMLRRGTMFRNEYCFEVVEGCHGYNLTGCY